MASDSTNADNTTNNKRDQSGETLTPLDQSNDPADVKITQEIRKKVTKNQSLSFMARNVKIITIGGKVTLRGPVQNAGEKDTIGKYAQKVAGAANVDNQLEVKTNN